METEAKQGLQRRKVGAKNTPRPPGLARGGGRAGEWCAVKRRHLVHMVPIFFLLLSGQTIFSSKWPGWYEPPLHRV